MNGINNNNGIYYSAIPTALNPQARNTGYYIPNKYDTVYIKNKEKNKKNTWFVPAVIVLSALAGTAGIELLLRKTTNKGILEHIGEVFKSSKKPELKPKPKSNPAPRPNPAPVAKPVQPVTTVLASKSDLLDIFKIPYSFTVHSQNEDPLNVAAKSLQFKNVMALGDLHASSRKLVETLIAGDFITMDEATAKALNKQLEALENAYSDPQSSRARYYGPNSYDPTKLKAAYTEINKLIPKIHWKPEAKGKQLILIGDVLADKGPLDTVTLDLVEYLTKGDHDDRIVRIVGNQDHEAYLRALAPLDEAGKSRRKLFNNDCTSIVNTSINPFKHLGTVDLQEEELEALQTKYSNYLSKAKLMHYDEKTNTLYCHAPITTKQIDALRAIIKTKLKAEPASDLPSLVEQANKLYQDYVTNNRYDEDIENFFANNFGQGGNFLCSCPLSNAKFPFQKENVRLVHGHDMDAKYSGPHNTVNLDNLVRKGEEKMADSLPIYVS